MVELEVDPEEEVETIDEKEAKKEDEQVEVFLDCRSETHQPTFHLGDSIEGN